MMESIEYSVRHNSAWSVKSMPFGVANARRNLGEDLAGRVPKKNVAGRDCNAAAKTARFFEDAPRSME